MLPQEYLDEKARHDRRKNFILWLSRLAVFFSSFFVIAPFLHEFSHLVVLFWEGCRFDLSIGFTIPFGIHGSVQPLCYLEETSLLMFYLSGHLGVLIASILSLTVYELRNKHILGLAGTGLLLSIPMALASYGDLFNASAILGVSGNLTLILSLILAVGVSLTSLRVLEKIFSQNGSNSAPGTP